ncbi:MAG: histidinol-phosphate transaminase [Atopobiaceae bacterium]|nr:histidinol-phosphate transaminase [Atopobiaceae bacterium]MCH4180787.1 histidinol-phosphate transaminase [Atopobiaceae bacterium]MCH4214448.1 histidinol-phosphate transaminase [Atopobiaceae bacterium]MCH4229378.1 histidinol-phosphate transaminase [Atopobiaceae bacterium]MCH4276664.1 histidinol-phosphate transaminase [Atopobiaceae bacterium]
MAGLSPRVRALVQPQLADFEPYDPGFKPCRINLSANENTWPLPQGMRGAMDASLASTPTNRYPDPMSNALRDELAAWHGVSRENVFVSNGGDEALFDLFLAFGGPGRTLLDCPPSFSVYELYSTMVGTTYASVPRDAETLAPDVDALVEGAASADIVVVTSPNNPTGDLFGLDGVERLARACPGLVLVDEAYGEFAPEGTSAASLMGTYDNVIVLHTLSKAFSCAGIRCGYLLAPADVVDALAAVRQPYSVNVLTQAVAATVVARRDAFAPTISGIVAERERLSARLAALAGGDAVRVWPSSANFLLVRLPHASEVRARLRDEYSILVRDFSATPGLADCLRVSVGTPAEDDALLDALATLLKEES